MVTMAEPSAGAEPRAESGPWANNRMLDVLVRFHDIGRMAELSRCVFSLVCQDYRPVTVWICTQRFATAQIGAVNHALAPVMALSEGIRLEIANFTAAEPRDARSALLNMGIRRGAGRYLAFLDYDDVIYPNGYQLLIDELHASGVAIAFGAIAVKHVDVGGDFTVTTGKARPFRGQTLQDLFEDNFCPIHSYVIDRAAVSPMHLYFDESMTRLEDYDFLLRFCATYLASFQLHDRVVGDYYWKNDGSNTVVVDGAGDESNARAWVLTRQILKSRRETILVSDAVQQSLGIDRPDPSWTISRLLDPSR